MYFRIIRNDLLKNKLITFITMMFVAAAAMLVSLAAILTMNLTGALDTLMIKAKTPHFLQMHAGEIDEARLTSFAEVNSNVDDFQLVKFLNIDGSHIQLGEQSLVDNVQDNGLTIQNEKFDYLLDIDGHKISVSDGEVYVPINYMKEYATEIGDKAVIHGHEFIVTGFLRDSQMNSSLSASKRFLVSENDFAKLQDAGNLEYLIEFRLKDAKKLGEFETAYAAAELEANGPTVTYTLFKMMNALSDGIMIAIILLISALVVAIALMCIRFTLLSKMEEDYHEIGVMKAIGLHIKDIKRIYFVKYAAIACIGSLLGFGLSLLFKDVLLENIRLSMGEADNASMALLLGVIGILLVLASILLYVSRVLKQFNKISAVEAIRFGMKQEKTTGSKRFHLNKNKFLPTNIFLGMKDVLARKKMYGTILTILVISSFIIIVPQNLYNTISSKSFTQYMGIGDYDLRIDIQQVENIPEKTAEILQKVSNDEKITSYAELTTKIFKAKMADGTEENVKVELGDHAAFPIAYSQGKAPTNENEISLSSINATEMSKQVGDKMTLLIDGVEQEFSISGIYSDITNGGKTAKAMFTDHSTEPMWSIVVAKLSDSADVKGKVLEYSSAFGYAKVSDVNEFVTQTFGSTISSVEIASYAAIGVAIVITVLITVLFMKMLVVKDRASIAVMKAIGFTNADIKIQYISRAVFVLMIGIGLGTLLANTVGEVLTGAIISSFGADTFSFTVNPLMAYVLCPLLMIGAVLIGTIGGTSGAGQIKISQNIKG